MNAYRFVYRFVRDNVWPVNATCIAFGETEAEAEAKVMAESKTVPSNVTGFEITSVSRVDTSRVIWGL